MRGKIIKPLIPFFILMFAAGFVFSQEKTNLTGTWKGSTYVEGADIELLLSLVLEHKGEKLTGKLSDDMGYIYSDISEAKLEGNTLTFKADAQAPEGQVTMVFTMTVAGDKMEGKWTADLYAGSWSPVREKEAKTEPADIEGTWIGLATIEMEAEPNELTLIINKIDGKLTGVMSDQFGVIPDLSANNIKLENGVVTFDVLAAMPQGDLTIKFNMKVDGTTMKGELEAVEMAAKGTWEAKKQVQ